MRRERDDGIPIRTRRRRRRPVALWVAVGCAAVLVPVCGGVAGRYAFSVYQRLHAVDAATKPGFTAAARQSARDWAEFIASGNGQRPRGVSIDDPVLCSMRQAPPSFGAALQMEFHKQANRPLPPGFDRPCVAAIRLTFYAPGACDHILWLDKDGKVLDYLDNIDGERWREVVGKHSER